MDLLQAVSKGHGTADRNNRIAFRVRRSQAGYQIGATGTGGDQSYSRFARHAPDTAGDECRVLFMPTDDRLDLRVQQRVEYLVDLCAGDAGNILDSLCRYTLHQ